jgi:maleylacetoacetate isomerase
MAAPNKEHRVLLNYWRSSSAWRVRIALALKGLEYEYKAVNLLKGEDTAPEYYRINPSGVPTLIDGDGAKPLTQSLAIVEYLEERYPAKPLLPRDFIERADVRAVANFIACLQPLQNLGTQQLVGAQFGDAAKGPWAKAVIQEGMEGLEVLLSRSAGIYCVGDTFTMADCFLAPQAYACRRFGVDLAQFPTISRVLAAVEAHEAVVASHPDRMPDAVK